MGQPNVDDKLTTSELSAHLMALILRGDETTENWIKLLITFESAIAFAYGFILQADATQINATARTVILSAAPIAAILGAVIIARIVVRGCQWHTWFVRKFNELPGNAGKVFADQPGVIAAQPRGHVATQVLLFSAAIVIGWVVIVIANAGMVGSAPKRDTPLVGGAQLAPIKK